MEIKFEVFHPGEPAAGILSYYETVKIIVETDPGGEEGEFEFFMNECLHNWFDGAKVTLVK